MRKKFLFIFLIMILISIIFIPSSFVFSAEDSNFSWNYNDYNYTIPKLKDNIDTTYGLIITGEEYKYFRIIELLDYPNDGIIHIASTYGGSFCYYTSSGALGKYNVWKYDLGGSFKKEYSNVTSWDWSLHYPPLYSDYDIYDLQNKLYFASNSIKLPEHIYPGIANTANDLSTAKFDYILITPGSYSANDSFDFVLRRLDEIDTESGGYVRSTIIYDTTLNSNSIYYKSVTVSGETEFWYEIPRNVLGNNLVNGKTYLFCLEQNNETLQEIQVTVGGLTQEDIIHNEFDSLKESNEKIKDSLDKQTDAIDKQTDAIKENNKTNKNIFDKIGEMLSYINPFSENFFGKKLVDLILNGLKSLFIPSDDFFTTYFNDLNEWFSDRFGFLYYPLDLLFNLLDRFLNINFSEPILNIPKIEEPFTGLTLIQAQNFNFNTLLENSVLKNVHDIYLIIVDAVIFIGLVILLYNKYEEVMTK